MTVPKQRLTGSSPLRPDIAESWHRVARVGLAPDTKLDRVQVIDVDHASKLMVAATPVLDELVTQLQDTALCVALADRHSVIIDTRFTDRRVASALERIGVVLGSTYSEEISGTNSIATPYKTHRGLLVHGEEHFLESLKKFSCYGLPIRHPVTRRIEGVLDITGIMPRANPLFVPLIKHAVQDIEQRLFEGSRRSEQVLLTAFQNAAKQRSRAVVVLGEGVVLTNPAAVDLLEAADHAMLRSVAPDVLGNRTLVRRLQLASGRAVDLEAHRIDGTVGTIFQLTSSPWCDGVAIPRRPSPEEPEYRVDRQLTHLRGVRSPVLISGEPGTGRSHAVRVIAGGDPVATLDATEVSSAGVGDWATHLHDLASTHDGVIAVEEIQLLPSVLSVRLASLLVRTSARFVLTSAPRDTLGPHAASLAASCVSRVDLPPLRRRRDELPSIVQALVRDLRPDDSIRFTPSALAALAAHQWPGNVRELAMVVRHAVEAFPADSADERDPAGDITAADLPEAYRSAANARSLTPWEQAEHDAILAALKATAGNKLRAAERLGISRSTLYNRIRAFKITL
ncbi:MAG: hypothetical protein GEU86_21400 [Actinophytocola sp.]|nr:hypothetical protein [Actinophytocola sp.]